MNCNWNSRSMGFENGKRASQYFNHPGFERLLQLVWKKYASLERAGGKVTLPGITHEECEAINGFFGWFRKAGETVEIPLRQFEKELRDSPFPSTIPELHLALTGKPLLTRSELQTRQEEEWQNVFRSLLADLEKEKGSEAIDIARWLERLKSGEAAGYRTLRDIYRTNPGDAERALAHVTKALLVLRSGQTFIRSADGAVGLETVRLPMLAAQVTGDSHAFDWKEPAGRLLWYGIVELWQRQTPIDEADCAEWGDDRDIAIDPFTIREGYRLAGIGDDDLSSQVLYYTADLRHDVQPMVLTLRQVEQLSHVEPCSCLYVVENPAVFSTLLDITQKVREKMESYPHGFMNDSFPILICTNGQPSVATIRLIERLLEQAKSECRLLYSGDFDVSGLHMALALAKRFAASFVPWRLGTDTYRQWSAHGPAFMEEEKERLSKLNIHWDGQLARTMAQIGKKCFQEAFITDLVEDWLKELRNL